MTPRSTQAVRLAPSYSDVCIQAKHYMLRVCCSTVAGVAKLKCAPSAKAHAAELATSESRRFDLMNLNGQQLNYEVCEPLTCCYGYARCNTNQPSVRSCKVRY